MAYMNIFAHLLSLRPKGFNNHSIPQRFQVDLYNIASFNNQTLQATVAQYLHELLSENILTLDNNIWKLAQSSDGRGIENIVAFTDIHQ